MPNIPDPKFAPAEMPWARAMQSQLESLTVALDRSDQNGLNTNKGQNATLQSLGDTVQTLGDTVQTLQGQVASIQTLLANQISPSAAFNSVTSFTLSTSPAELCRVTFTAPAGFTRAVVVAVGAITAINSQSGVDQGLRGYVDINGLTSVISIESTVQSLEGGAVSPSATTLITGLSSGATFYARTVGSFSTGAIASNASNRATITAQAIFLR